MRVRRPICIALGLAALTACSKEGPVDPAAHGIEANAEIQAESLDESAHEAANQTAEDLLENTAAALPHQDSQ